MAAQQIQEYPGVAAAVAPLSKSAASWPAIFSGASVAAAVSLILIALGSGLGFAAISPWPRSGISGMSLAVTAAIWLIVTQWLSAAVGGYLAGRLRTRWIGTHEHEIFFRDTAHGLISWAVATLFVAALFAAAAFSATGMAAKGVAAAATAGAATAASATAPGPSSAASYEIDRLLRPAEGAANMQPGSGTANGADVRPEVARIIANAAVTGDVPDTDRTYLARVVAARTGASPDDAKKRVDDFIASVQSAETKTKEAADTARKAAAQASIYLALSLLVGAFIASVSAVLGGHLRDEHP
jgi:hypothetical protein